MIGIQAIYAYTPGKQVAATTLAEFADLEGPEKEYFLGVGIQSIRDAEGLGGYDLALGAARGLLAEAGIASDELDYILYIRPRIPDAFISSEAARLQMDLGAEKALPFALGDLGCTDSTLAIQMGVDLLKANRRARNVLVAYGHKQYSPWRFRYPVTIQGDGGIACLVSRCEQNQVREIGIDVNGKYWDLFQMAYRDRTFAEYREQCSDPRKYGFELAIESKNRFTDLNAKLLERAGWAMGDIDHVLMQNISARAFTYYEQAFGFQLAPTCRENLSRYGHLGCADILLNLKAGIEQGRFVGGQKVMVLNNSPVAAWGTFLMEL